MVRADGRKSLSGTRGDGGLRTYWSGHAGQEWVGYNAQMRVNDTTGEERDVAANALWRTFEDSCQFFTGDAALPYAPPDYGL